MAHGRITQFFYNLMAYGGISTENGLILIWGDPNVFFPMKSFVFLQSFLEKKFGEAGSNILYWLGKVNGRTATEVLIKRYGFNSKDLDKFVNGATQDGFGYFEITNVKHNPLHAVLVGTNCVYAEAYRAEYGKQKCPVCHYIGGIIAGGSEPLFNRSMKIEEEKCVAKGDSKCVIHDIPSKGQEKFPLVEKSGIDTESLLKKSTERYFRVAGSYKVVTKRNVRLGDGSFMCNGVGGVVVAQRMVIILFQVLETLLKKDFEILMDGIAQRNIDAVYSPKIKFSMYPQTLNSILATLSTFGLGEFTLESISGKSIKVANKTSTYPIDHQFILGGGKKPCSLIPAMMLKKLFEKCQKKKVSVASSSCVNCNSSKCVYEIKLG